MNEPYTETQAHADRLNVVVLGRFLEKHPRCQPVRQGYNAAKARLEWAQEQRKKHVFGTEPCPERSNGQTHFAIQDSIGPTYSCFYCCADMF